MWTSASASRSRSASWRFALRQSGGSSRPATGSKPSNRALLARPSVPQCCQRQDVEGGFLLLGARVDVRQNDAHCVTHGCLRWSAKSCAGLKLGTQVEDRCHDAGADASIVEDNKVLPDWSLIEKLPAA